MSKATIVSIANYEIGPETKPGLHPATYTIPPATDLPAVLHLENSFHDIPQLNYKTIRITVDAEEVAESVVNDYRRAQIVSAPGAMPGVFWLPGHVYPADVADRCQEIYLEENAQWDGKGEKPYNKLTRAIEEHTEWCRQLVKRADDTWADKKQRRVIATTMINAARFLELEREWMSIDFAQKAEKCPACRELVESGSVVCGNCKLILNKEKYESFEFASR